MLNKDKDIFNMKTKLKFNIKVIETGYIQHKINYVFLSYLIADIIVYRVMVMLAAPSCRMKLVGLYFFFVLLVEIARNMKTDWNPSKVAMCEKFRKIYLKLHLVKYLEYCYVAVETATSEDITEMGDFSLWTDFSKKEC